MKSAGRHLIVEWLFVAAIAAGLAHVYWFFQEYRYLPLPFIYEPSATFMDWYSLSRWAQIGGAYDIEKSIYPPLSFVILRIFTFPACYTQTHSEEVRACDWLGFVFITSVWFINIFLTYYTFRKIDRRTALPRTIALAMGLPMLYGLERGNFIIPTYTMLVLAFGPLLRSARLRWVAAGLMVNFKVYLISAVAAPLLRRRWTAVEGMVIAIVLVYLASWIILGDGSPAQYVSILAEYRAGFASDPAMAVLNLWFANSYIPIEKLITGEFPINNVIGQQAADIALLYVSGIRHLTHVAILCAALACWLRPEAVSTPRVVFLAIAFALNTAEAGGYVQVFLLLFVFMERWQGFYRAAALVLAYLLCVPYDVGFGNFPTVLRNSFLGGTLVTFRFYIGYFMLLRPTLICLIAIFLSLDSIQAVVRDIRINGRAPRWRFRRDAQLLPAVSPRSAGGA